jgi:hypothetical protein
MFNACAKLTRLATPRRCSACTSAFRLAPSDRENAGLLDLGMRFHLIHRNRDFAAQFKLFLQHPDVRTCDDAHREIGAAAPAGQSSS